MGGTTFEDYCSIDRAQTAQDAYRVLCRDADSEHGNQGYTGAINVTGGFRMHTSTVMTQADAAATWNKLLDSDDNPYNDKWGDCMCIAVGIGKVKQRTFNATLDVPTNIGLYEYQLAPLLPTPLAAGERLIKLEILEQKATYKHRVVNHRGPATRVFVLVNGKGVVVGDYASRKEATDAVLDARKATEAAWRKQVAERIDRGWGPVSAPDFGIATIREEVRRGGEAAANVITDATRKVKVRVTAERTVEQPTKVTGFFFAGWASC